MGRLFKRFYCCTIVGSLASRNSNDPSLHASKGALMWHNQSSFFLYLTSLFYYIFSYYLQYTLLRYILFQYYRPLIIQGRLEVIDIGGRPNPTLADLAAISKVYIFQSMKHGKYRGWNGSTVEISCWANLARPLAGMKSSPKNLCSHVIFIVFFKS